MEIPSRASGAFIWDMATKAERGSRGPAMLLLPWPVLYISRAVLPALRGIGNCKHSMEWKRERKGKDGYECKVSGAGLQGFQKEK